MGVELHIEELVLHGFAANDRRRIADAVERELTRLMESMKDAHPWQRPISLDRIDGGSIRIKVNSRPQDTGTQIARAIFGKLQRSSQGTTTTHRSQSSMRRPTP